MTALAFMGALLAGTMVWIVEHTTDTLGVVVNTSLVGLAGVFMIVLLSISPDA